LLHVYANNDKYQVPYQKQLNYFKRQFFIAEDIVQQIIVLTQLLKIHKKVVGTVKLEKSNEVNSAL
jgi:hypothetical protein